METTFAILKLYLNETIFPFPRERWFRTAYNLGNAATAVLILISCKWSQCVQYDILHCFLIKNFTCRMNIKEYLLKKSLPERPAFCLHESGLNVWLYLVIFTPSRDYDCICVCPFTYSRKYGEWSIVCNLLSWHDCIDCNLLLWHAILWCHRNKILFKKKMYILVFLCLMRP